MASSLIPLPGASMRKRSDVRTATSLFILLNLPLCGPVVPVRSTFAHQLQWPCHMKDLSIHHRRASPRPCLAKHRSQPTTLRTASKSPLVGQGDGGQAQGWSITDTQLLAGMLPPLPRPHRSPANVSIDPHKL
jgi:hypothetical protein